MNKRIFCLLGIVLTFAIVTAAFAQQTKLDTLNRKFSQAREKALQEKLYLHVDRNFYLTGESMWFKIYQVDAALHRPVNLSKVAYVEILDKDNQSLVQAKIKLTNEGGHGTLFLPATLSSGNYVLRAYTQWMKNFPSEYYFHKAITVVNPFLKAETVANKKPAAVHVEFFPEGGNLVAGIRSKVAFKITNTEELENYSGHIINGSGDTLTAIRPLKFNLGHFFFTPSQGERYRCVLRNEKGVVTTHQLPTVYSAGYVMQLSDSTGDLIKVRVQQTGKETSISSYAFLFVHSRQMIVQAEARPFQHNRQTEFVLDRKKIPDGISHFTVFNDDLQPVCERLYFVKPKTKLQIHVKTDQKEYSPRRKVAMEIQSMLDNKNIPASVSVSVFRLDSLGTAVNGMIEPYLLLTSDLRGDVESPEFYFSDATEAREAADNLMLTHGWRRFKWEAILGKNEKFRFVPELRTHIVGAKVLKNDNTPVANVLAFLSSPSKLVDLNGSRSDGDGNLVFEVHDFYGSRKVILQTNSKFDSSYVLRIDDPFSKTFAQFPVSPLKLNSSTRENLKVRSLSMQVQDIYYRDVIEKPAFQSKKDSTAFFGKPDQSYFLDNYTRFPVLEEVMREYVPGVLVRKRRDGFHFLLIDLANKGILDGDPLVMIDGVPVFDLNRLMAFDPLKIRKLEVIMRSYALGPVRIPGMVSYSTYTGDLAGFEFNAPALVLNYEGLQLQREFYAPAYENTRLRNNRMPDQRTLLMWKPIVRTENGAQAIEFFTSDVPGTYQVVVEGLTANGEAGSGSHTFSVKGLEF